MRKPINMDAARQRYVGTSFRAMIPGSKGVFNMTIKQVGDKGIFAVHRATGREVLYPWAILGLQAVDGPGEVTEGIIKCDSGEGPLVTV